MFCRSLEEEEIGLGRLARKISMLELGFKLNFEGFDNFN
jgi:hypothetical protein